MILYNIRDQTFVEFQVVTELPRCRKKFGLSELSS